jgi:hypothetical protein
LGELYKPKAKNRGDHLPLRFPLPPIEEEFRRRLERSKGFRLVCTVCGRAFGDPLEAWVHQERNGHRCFRIEVITA